LSTLRAVFRRRRGWSVARQPSFRLPFIAFTVLLLLLLPRRHDTERFAKPVDAIRLCVGDENGNKRTNNETAGVLSKKLEMQPLENSTTVADADVGDLAHAA
jgi:hypothetical protein